MSAEHADCTVLVASCDRYADVIGPFGRLFARFWPDCPFEVVLVTETDIGPVAGVSRVVACGAGGTWAGRLVRALDTVTTPYVLMLCDDYYLEAPVDTARLLARLDQARRLNAANLRLVPNPRRFRPRPAADGLPLGEYPKNTAYCISTLAGFWARDFLRRLAARTASIWEFERYGSFACADEPRPLLVTPAREFPFVDAVHKGYWEPFGCAVCARNGIALDFSVRGRPPLKVRLTEAFKAFVFAVFPATWIVRVQNLLGVGAREKPQAKGNTGDRQAR